MIRAMSTLRDGLRRFWRATEGTATVEFVIVFPVIMMLVFQSLEAGWIMVRKTMLDRAVDMTVRDLRLGHLPNPTNDSLRQHICSLTAVINNCTSSLMIELKPIDTSTYSLPSANAPCVDRTAKIQPVTTVQQGAGDNLMLIRVCAVVDLLFPGTGLGLALPKDASGGLDLVSSSAFVNEPS